MQVQHYRVYNKCKFDIGVELSNHQQIVIKAGNFQLMTADDIVYIEGMCTRVKYFAKRWLIAVDKDGKEVSSEELGTYIVPDDHPHLSEDEVKDLLKKPAAEIKEYLSEETDPAELHSIASVAAELNLTADKLKIIKKKVPNMDLFIENDDEEDEPKAAPKKPTTRTSRAKKQ